MQASAAHYGRVKTKLLLLGGQQLWFFNFSVICPRKVFCGSVNEKGLSRRIGVAHIVF